jgi:hypothetical protein
MMKATADRVPYSAQPLPPLAGRALSARKEPAMTARDALAEIAAIIDRIRSLDEDLHHAMSDPGSAAATRLVRDIADAIRRKEWLLDQLPQLPQSSG